LAKLNLAYSLKPAIGYIIMKQSSYIMLFGILTSFNRLAVSLGLLPIVFKCNHKLIGLPYSF